MIHQPNATAGPKPRPRLGFLSAPAAVALLVLLAPSPVRAAKPVIEVENIRIGFALPNDSEGANTFKVGKWAPVRIQLRAGDAPFVGFMEVLSSDDDGTPTAFRLPVNVAAGQSGQYTGYVRSGLRESDLGVTLYNQDRKRVLRATQGMLLKSSPRMITPEESLILTLGRPHGLDLIGGLPGFRRGGDADSAGSAASDLIVAPVDPKIGMPGRWYGYDAAKAVVVDTNDVETVAALADFRGQALVEWVKRGGHLVVSVGENWQAVVDGALGPILPAVPNGRERLASLEALDTFADANKPITPPGAPAVYVAKLEEIEARGGKVLSVTSGLPLVVRGPCGFGRVTLIGVDTDRAPFAEWPDRALFWVRAVDLKRQHSDQPANVGIQFGGRRLNQTGVADLSTQLRSSLDQFPGVKLIPFGWVAFFIFLYILLIGPGDYFLLRKVFGRMELTWITFPAIVVSVSLAAYCAAYFLKGNDLLINKVDVVDVDQVTGLTRGSTFVNLFSPQNRDYTLGAIPAPLDRDAPAVAEPSSGETRPRPPAKTEVLTSWFSAPDAQFGGMGSSRPLSFGSGGYGYGPEGSAEFLEGVRVPIWCSRSVSSRWFGPAGPPLVESDLRPVGTDRLAGFVTNRQTVPLQDAVLAFGKQVYLLDDVPPGATVNVQLKGDRNLSGLLRDKMAKVLPDARGGYLDPAKINRADLLLTILFHESQSFLASEQTVANDPLGYLDLSGQLALDRPMLVAKINRPGSSLLLGNASGTPKIDQTTLVRIILPLKSAKPSG